MSHWTDGRISTLTTMWNEGRTGRQIARKLGTTVNMVLGKARRLRLPPRTTTYALGQRSPDNPSRRAQIERRRPPRQHVRKPYNPARDTTPEHAPALLLGPVCGSSDCLLNMGASA